jgi:mannose-6-phosphate isomerase
VPFFITFGVTEKYVMQGDKKIYKLLGSVQYYAWGGFDFIPALLGVENSGKKPFAEYWLGAHASASAKLESDAELLSWYELMRREPVKYLGDKVDKKFGQLPYLFKVLDVREMLSIQVHPTKEEAIKGFEREEAAGIPMDAPNRNYKDRNHKPEVMVALSEFWLLHGFKKEDDLKETLQSIPEFASLLPVFEKEGYYGLYKTVMEFSMEQSDDILKPLVLRELQTTHPKGKPGYWIKKLYPNGFEGKNVDKGIFSVYFFNIIELQPGQGIFQGAGVPHAYLEGQNVELMANSDNVLRGGLTPKHIDVPELLKHISFEATEPNVLSPAVSLSGEINYPLPAEDFAISAIQLQSGQQYKGRSGSSEVLLVMSGGVWVDKFLQCKRGEAFAILPDTNYTVAASADATLLYKAFVPLPVK